IWESVLMILSVMPSERYSISGSLLAFMKGRIATESIVFLDGRDRALDLFARLTAAVILVAAAAAPAVVGLENCLTGRVTRSNSESLSSRCLSRRKSTNRSPAEW